MIVLALITAFAIVGLSFVLYADSEAKAAQIARDAEQGLIVNPYDVDPKATLSNFLGQLIFDVSDAASLTDTTFINSALRGHSLARSMYGYNDSLNAGGAIAFPNTTPFNGVGRLHNTLTSLPASFGSQDEYNMVNYQSFFATDKFLRDPERPGVRTANAKNTWLCGFNAPYTYADLNNMFLAVMDSSGNVLQPSYHRTATFGALDNTANANWSNAVGKYLTMRPRPADNNGFPFPEDAGGDVKNLLGNPGGNDSIWTDLGSPVRTAPNGKTYKAMFAPLILELDSRLNLVTHGNILGTTSGTPVHVSNTGWGPWSVNLGLALKDYTPLGTLPAANTEWINTFTGNSTPPKVIGRYGSEATPVPGSGASATIGTFPIPAGQAGVFPTFAGKGYSRIDIDEGNSPSAGAARSQIGGPLSPTFAAATSPVYFPTYLPGYQATLGATQFTNHPMAYNTFSPAAGDRNFTLDSMESLLRFNDSTSYSISGDLVTLCPNLFSQQRPRNMVTTRSFDVDAPGISPAISRGGSSYAIGTTSLRPVASAANFPSVSTIAGLTSSDFNTGDGRMNFQPSSVGYSLSKRLDLNRPLPEYPQPGSDGKIIPADMAKFTAAQQARQDFAKDIFDRLRLITGADDPSSVPAAPATSAAKDALRWLAQLAVNIVDFIDDDDIMTPFPWCVPSGASTPEYVFGIESPKLLINEVFVQIKPGPSNTAVDVFVELMNPSNADTTLLPDGGNVRVSSSINPYVLSVCKFNSFNTITNVANSIGVPDSGYAPSSSALGSSPNQVQTKSPSDPTLCQVSTEFNLVPGGVLPAYNGGLATAFVVLGNPSPTTSTPTGSPISGISPTVNSAMLSYSVSGTTATSPTIVLQRLACPSTPFDANTNPYITVDVFQNACGDSSGNIPLANTNSPSNPLYAPTSSGRPSPFIDLLSSHANQTTGIAPNVKQTFGQVNSNASTANNQWLVHLDRYLSSPMELLNVSGCKPTELTQRFGDTSASTTMGVFNHRVPWFDEDLGGGSSHLLYRFFELVETRSLMAGMGPAVFSVNSSGSALALGSSTIPVQSLAAFTTNGSLVTIGVGDVLTVLGQDSSHNVIMENVRVNSTTASSIGITNPLNQGFASAALVHTATGGLVAGKLNLNSMFDPEIFSALCDASTANKFTQANDVTPIYTSLNAAIHAGTSMPAPPTVGSWADPRTDRPSLGNAQALFGGSDTQYTAGSGIGRTLFRPGSAVTTAMLEAPSAPAGPATHPYLRYELLNKIYNNTTSRSNVFAVWLTVGFFECDASGNNLGAEIGKSEGKSIRHRMFAIVDRTGLAVPRQVGTLSTGISAATGAQAIGVTSTSGINVNTQLLIGSPGTSNVEVVTVTGVSASQIQAVFTQAHAATDPVSIMPGNWGPQPGFDVTQPVNSQIVPYYSIIE